jgi:hypothetical protein
MIGISATAVPSCFRPLSEKLTSRLLQSRLDRGRLHSAIVRRAFITNCPRTPRPKMEDTYTRDFAGGDQPQTPTHADTEGASSSRNGPVAFDLEANAPIRRNFSTHSRASPRRTSTVSSVRTDGTHGRIHRLIKRANTVVHYHNDLEDPRPATHFEHGAEPGIDTRQDIEPEVPSLGKTCQTTVVDFSEDKIEKHEFDNDELIDFLEKPRADWAKCRWINVNGLSWTVIKALGNKYKLHRLAVEDLLNTRGRAKVDWYPENVFSEQCDSH